MSDEDDDYLDVNLVLGMPTPASSKKSLRNRLIWVHRILDTDFNTVNESDTLIFEPKPDVNSELVSMEEDLSSLDIKCDPLRHHQHPKTRPKRRHWRRCFEHFLDKCGSTDEQLISHLTYNFEQELQEYIGTTEEEEQQQSQKQDLWKPPITAVHFAKWLPPRIFSNIRALHEFSLGGPVSLRLRVKDPREEMSYWDKVDRILHNVNSSSFWECLSVIMEHMVAILQLVFLVERRHSFNPLLRIAPNTVKMLLLSQQMPLVAFVTYIRTLFQRVCDARPHHQLKFHTIMDYYKARRFGLTLQCCWSLLEAIHMENATYTFQSHRVWWLQKCAALEWLEYFRYPRPLIPYEDWRPLEVWFSKVQRQHLKSFKSVYFSALIYLVTERHKKRGITFPHTLKYDRKRIVEYRNEFHRLVMLAVISLPYYCIAGRSVNRTDLELLFVKLSNTVKDRNAISARMIWEERDSAGRITYYGLAMIVWKAAEYTRRGLPAMAVDESEVRFWSKWLASNLRKKTLIRVLYESRIRDILIIVCLSSGLTREIFAELSLSGLHKHILELGLRIQAVGNLNLRTFGLLYSAIWRHSTSLFVFSCPEINDP